METTELLEFLFERGLVGVLEATVNLSVVGVEKAGEFCCCCSCWNTGCGVMEEGEDMMTS